MIEALILDMDGTMCDSMPFHDRAWVAFLEQRGVPVQAERFLADTAGMRNVDIVRNYLGAALDEAQARAVGEQKEALFRALYAAHLQPVPGLHDALRWARTQGLRVALATSADRANIDFTLERLGLADAFETIVESRDVQRGKPAPDCYLLAARRLGLAPARCLVIEDAPSGIEAARRAGMAVAVIRTRLDARQVAALRCEATHSEATHGEATQAPSDARGPIVASADDFAALDLPAVVASLVR